MNIWNYVEDLIAYAVAQELIAEEDRVWATNRVLETLHLSDHAPEAHEKETNLEIGRASCRERVFTAV